MDSLRIEDVTDPEGLRALSSAWEVFRKRFPRPPAHAHPEHLALWLEILGGDAAPRVVVAWSGGEMVGFVPLMEVTETLGPFRRPCLRFIGNNIGYPGDISYHEAWALEPRETIVREMLAHARKRWRAAAWDLGFLPPSSATSIVAERFLRYRENTERHPRSKPFLSLDLPSSWDAYLAGLSQGTRYKFRKFMRRLGDLGRIEVLVHRAPDDCERTVRGLIRNHERWWNGTPKEDWFGGAAAKEFLVASARWLAARKEMAGFELVVNGTPIAWQAGAFTSDLYFSELMSYDPSQARHSPGTVLSLAMIQPLIEAGVRSINLGPGTDQRKRTLGGIAEEYPRVQGFLGAWRMFAGLHAWWTSGRRPTPREPPRTIDEEAEIPGGRPLGVRGPDTG
jgi:CelD/BcsL family acetyltransferase involved in cellulose biosynthesis